jgi:hypothetical protein
VEGNERDEQAQQESRHVERRISEVEATPTGQSESEAKIQPGVFAAEYKAHSGPLPAQEWFAGLEAIHPGSTEIILRDFTEERQHQRRMQERALGLDSKVFSEFSRYQRTRLWIAGGLALFLAAGGLALILLDKAVYGFVLLIAEITGLVSVFLVGKVIKADDLDDLADLDDEELDRLLEEVNEDDE